MEVLEITSENAEDFSRYIDGDLAEQLLRPYFRGLGAMDYYDNVKGALVYEMKNAESEKETKSRIMLFDGEDEEAKRVLLEAYESAAKDAGIKESCYESEDEAMARALQENGFSLETAEAPDVVVTMADVRKLCDAAGVKEFPLRIADLTAVDILQYRSFVKQCIAKKKTGLVEDLSYLPRGWFDEELSSVSLDGDGMDGALLVRRTPSGIYHALLFTAFGSHYQQDLALLLAYTAAKAVDTCPKDARLVIRRHNATIRSLTDKFFADSKGAKVFVGARKEA